MCLQSAYLQSAFLISGNNVGYKYNVSIQQVRD